MIQMSRCERYRIKKYFMDKLLISDLSINNVYKRSTDDGVYVTMVPTDIPNENLVIIEDQNKIGLMYTKTTLFDSHVFDFIVKGKSHMHYATHLDGLTLIDGGRLTLDRIKSIITIHRDRVMRKTEEDIRGDLHESAINIMKNGGKVNEWYGTWKIKARIN